MAGGVWPDMGGNFLCIQPDRGGQAQAVVMANGVQGVGHGWTIYDGEFIRNGPVHFLGGQRPGFGLFNHGRRQSSRGMGWPGYFGVRVGQDLPGVQQALAVPARQGELADVLGRADAKGAQGNDLAGINWGRGFEQLNY